jgi:GNAT superfamily N-acetyltransferase
MPRARITLREVQRPADPALPRAYRLAARAFHKAEMVGPAEWRDSLREREAGLWSDVSWRLVIAERGKTVLGVATGTYLGNINSGVTGYLAVSPAARGLGLGPRLRRRLTRLFHQDALRIRHRLLEGIIGEVRLDNPWLRTLVRCDRVIALDFAYHQPQLRRGSRPVALVLYYERLTGVAVRFTAARLRRLLYTIWRRIYRIARPTSDPAFRRMLADLAGRTSIGRLRLRP